MATTRRHGETQAPLEGFEGALEQALEWVQERSRAAVWVSVGLLVAGATLAGTYEWLNHVDERSQLELDRVERELTVGLGGRVGAVWVPEPANRAQAQAAREQALAGFESLIEEYDSGIAGLSAILRAAEVEIDLGRLEAAETRLREAQETLAEEPLLRASGLRLQGFALEQLGRHDEAGEAYAAAASTPGYPAPEVVWVAAGESFLRAGRIDRAIGAFSQALEVAPDLPRLRERVQALELIEERSAPDPAPEPPAG